MLNRSLCCMVLATLVCGGAFAQTWSPQKNIEIVVGSAPGGGFDFYARTIAKYLTKYIPGSPVVMPQNMPGGGGISAGSRVAVTAPQDGTYIGGLPRTITMSKVYGLHDHGVQFDIEIECNECGRLLSAYNPRQNLITVEPCETCIDKAREEGREE